MVTKLANLNGSDSKRSKHSRSECSNVCTDSVLLNVSLVESLYQTFLLNVSLRNVYPNAFNFSLRCLRTSLSSAAITFPNSCQTLRTLFDLYTRRECDHFVNNYFRAFWLRTKASKAGRGERCTHSTNKQYDQALNEILITFEITRRLANKAQFWPIISSLRNGVTANERI